MRCPVDLVGVGKSCLMLQFIDKRFRTTHDITLGVEYGNKKVSMNKRTITLKLWDTAGSEAFQSITRHYYSGAIGALLVYDVTQKQSFAAIPNWLKILREVGDPDMAIVLIGNKCDLHEEYVYNLITNPRRQVPFSEGECLAQKFGLCFFETSAKTGQNVDDTFMKLTKQLCDRIDAGQLHLHNVHQGIQILNLPPTDPGLVDDDESCSC